MPIARKIKKTKKEDNIDTDEESLTYELGYLLSPAISEDQLGEEIGALRACIESHGDVPFSEAFPSRRNLAYKISRSLGGRREHFEEAYFGWVKFDALPRSIEAIKKDLDNKLEIIRSMIVKVPREVEQESITSIRKVTEHKKKDMRIFNKTEKKQVETSKPVISDEELDKTIEELIGE
jgi:ribosomal protein S6